MDFQTFFDEINEIHNSYEEKVDLYTTFVENAIMDYKIQIAEEELRVLTESENETEDDGSDKKNASDKFLTKIKAAVNKAKLSLSVACSAINAASKSKLSELQKKIDSIKSAIKENPAIGNIKVKCPDVKALLRKGQETLHKVYAEFAKQKKPQLSPELKKEMSETVKLLRSAFNEKSEDYSKYLTEYSVAEITEMVSKNTDAVKKAEDTFNKISSEIQSNMPSDIKTEAEAIQYISSSTEFMAALSNLLEATAKLETEAKFASARLVFDSIKEEASNKVASQKTESVKESSDETNEVKEGEDMNKSLIDEFEQLFESADGPLDDHITLESIENEIFHEKESVVEESAKEFDPEAYLEMLEKSLDE